MDKDLVWIKKVLSLKVRISNYDKRIFVKKVYSINYIMKFYC